MTSRTVVGGLMTLVGVACRIWFGMPRSAEQQRDAPALTRGVAPRAADSSVPAKETRTAGNEAKGRTGVAEQGTAPRDVEADFPIAAPLNAPESTVARDLDIVSQLFEAWQSNFPSEGNPVGENTEITADRT